MEEPMMTEEQRDETQKFSAKKADVPDKSGELLTQGRGRSISSTSFASR